MTDITTYSGGQPMSLVPNENEIISLFKLSETLCSTNFVPDAFRGKPAETLAAILYGRELNLGPMQSLQQINVIKGKPSASPELMRALVRRAGHSIQVIESTDTACVLEGRRADDGTIERSSFTMADARTANLVGGGAWKTYPKAMLLARATSQLCRSLFADVISGISYTPEELTAIDAPAPSLVAIQHEAQPAGLASGLIPARDAVKELVTACGGVVEEAKVLWGARGNAPISRIELDELLLSIEDDTEAVEADVLLGIDENGEVRS